MSRVPTAFGCDESGVIGYMCLTDFEHELGCAKGGNVIYPSESDLRENCRCIPQCGVVKVKVIGVEVLQESDYDAVIYQPNSSNR